MDQSIENKDAVVLCDQWLHLLDQMNIGAFTIDENRRVTSFNRSIQALTGIQEIEALGKDCRDIFKDIPCYGNCPFKNSSKPDVDYSDVEIIDSQDTRHMITRLVTPLYGEGRDPQGCLIIFQDHSHFANLINRIHYEERSMKIILDNLDIGIFTVNRGGYITFFNTASEKITGYNRRQMLGRLCSVLFKDSDASDIGLLRDAMTDGGFRANRNGKLLTQEGITIPIRADYIPLQNEDGRIVGGLATLQDLTLAKQFNEAISDRYTFHNMIGKDPLMQKVFERVRVVAESNATVLIEGETGTGKDLLAKVIHSASRRFEKPMIKINCAALPDTLLESELFGYLKGAFTGADQDKPGRFQEADGGDIASGRNW